MGRERDSQFPRTAYLQEEKCQRSDGERNMAFQSHPQVSLEPMPLIVVTELHLNSKVARPRARLWL